jgi:lipoprotein-releasing system ATP-binding protein
MDMISPASAPAAAVLTSPVLSLRGIERRFESGGRILHVLRQAECDLAPGQVVALVGPSGAGKSSLLHVAGLLESPDAGQVIINGRDCGKLGERERTRVRRAEIGFVYQFHHLLPEFSALENVVLPQMILGRSRREASANARAHLTTLGLGDRADHRPAQMSGGEQQRVAIARALANNPAVLLADEPTGNLDPETAERVFNELMVLIRTSGRAALIATHNFDLAKRMDRVLRLEGGKLVEG